MTIFVLQSVQWIQRPGAAILTFARLILPMQVTYCAANFDAIRHMQVGRYGQS